MKKKKKQSGSKISQFLFLIILAGTIAFLFKIFTDKDSGFKIESSGNTFKSPQRKEVKEVDKAGHTEDFWTNNKFKW